MRKRFIGLIIGDKSLKVYLLIHHIKILISGLALEKRSKAAGVKLAPVSFTFLSFAKRASKFSASSVRAAQFVISSSVSFISLKVQHQGVQA
jgi:hypothetical protein